MLQYRSYELKFHENVMSDCRYDILAFHEAVFHYSTKPSNS